MKNSLLLHCALKQVKRRLVRFLLSPPTSISSIRQLVKKKRSCMFWLPEVLMLPELGQEAQEG
jgi:hypothetical protein